MIQIIYGDIALGAAENASYSDKGKQDYAETASLSSGADPLLIATGEPGRWKLDGTVDLLGFVTPPGGYGYISDAISGAGGAYSGEVGIDILFPDKYSSSGITITFDPTEAIFYTVTVRWYDGETLKSEKTCTSDAAEYAMENAVELYNKIAIRFTASSVPQRYARISKVVFGVGRRFTPSDFDSARVTQEVNPISEELAIDTSSFTIRTRRGTDFVFQAGQSFRICKDSALIASHYLKSASMLARNQYSLQCQSAIGLLEEQKIAAKMYTAATAETIAWDILGDAFPFEMDEALKSITLSGYYPEGTRRYALHQLLFAIGARCSTVASEKIRIFQPSAEVKTIPDANLYTDSSVERGSAVTAVELEYHSFSTTKTAGAREIKIGEDVYYDTPGTLTKENPNVVSGTPENICKVTSATLVDQARAAALLDSVFDYFVNNSTLTEKILVTDEAPGDKVTTKDIALKPFSGDILSRETILSNRFASTIQVRGRYLDH